MIGRLRARAASTPRSPAQRPLHFEPLEDRRLLAATDLELLFDVRTGPDPSSPSELTVVGGHLFFAASDGASNRELWKTDGTPEGTVQVKDIMAGGNSLPMQLTDVNGTLYFTAQDAANNRELWKSDGSPNGTVKVKEINSTGSAFGNTAATTTPFAVIGNTVFFRADDGTNGVELWKSDGTPDGTTRITNIHASGSSNPSYLAVVGQTLYFAATDGADVGLWKTDVAGSTVTRVKNIHATGDDAVAFLTAMGNTLYFRADDGSTGYELWKSDGTADGTVMVRDIRPGGATSSAFPNQLTVVGNTLYFSAIDQGANRELWKSDGTPNGTVKVKEINANLNSANPQSLTVVGSTLYFVASDGTNTELWKSNGTDAGTVRVKASHQPPSPTELTNVAGTLYFAGAGAGTGVELWRSDGTDAGTQLVKEIESGPTGSAPMQITDLAGRVFLVATTTANGAEVWRESPTSYGDFDHDRDVDGGDFLAWQRSFGTTNALVDANRNGTVDGADLVAWGAGFGYAMPAVAAAAASGSGGSVVSVGGSPLGVLLMGDAPDTLLAGDESAKSQTGSDEVVTPPPIAEAMFAAREAALEAIAPPSTDAAVEWPSVLVDADASSAGDLTAELADAAFARLL